MTTKHQTAIENQFNGKTIPGTFVLHPFFFFNTFAAVTAIVDIGCGAGRVCFDLLRRGYGPITGVDQNEHCIRFANEKLQEMTLTDQKCKYLKCDALETGLKEKSFDIGIMMAFLTTLTTPKTRLHALREGPAHHSTKWRPLHWRLHANLASPRVLRTIRKGGKRDGRIGFVSRNR